MPRLCEVNPGKNLSQGSLRMLVGKEYTEQSIYVNKNDRTFKAG
jgi:hypothetical protein